MTKTTRKQFLQGFAAALSMSIGSVAGFDDIKELVERVKPEPPAPPPESVMSTPPHRLSSNDRNPYYFDYGGYSAAVVVRVCRYCGLPHEEGGGYFCPGCGGRKFITREVGLDGNGWMDI